MLLLPLHSLPENLTRDTISCSVGWVLVCGSVTAAKGRDAASESTTQSSEETELNSRRRARGVKGRRNGSWCSIKNKSLTEFLVRTP